MTTKILTVRIPLSLYSSLCSSAAEFGVPVSAHVRRVLENENQGEQAAQLQKEVLSRLDQMNLPPSSYSAQSLMLDELLLLNRAIAAHLHPQLVSRVQSKLAAQQLGGST